MATSKYIEALAAGHYAFIDLGSGSGGSIDHCLRRFGREPGLGFELDPNETAEAVRAGYDVVEADLLNTQVPERSVAFVSAMDFLEHLPDATAAASVLERFAVVAREFIFIRHPSFQEKEYLASLGLKLCWTDWSGHPNDMLIEDFMALFRRFGMNEYTIIPRRLMIDPSDDQIVPLSAPTDTMVYDPAAHGPKPSLRFDRPIFGQYDIFVRLKNGLSDAEWERVLSADVAEDAPSWAIQIVSPERRAARYPQCSFGFYDSETSHWRIRRANSSEVNFKYGAEGRGWLPFTGKFTAGKDSIGVYDPATGDFFIRHVLDGGLADVAAGFGAAGGIPITGDWTGSGSDMLGVYMPDTGQWFLRYGSVSGPADESFSFGPSGSACLPVVGDWDGSGRDSVGLYDPSTASWHLRRADHNSDVSFTFGPAHGFPLAGDWDGDGRDSIGVYAPEWEMWVLRNTNSNGPADTIFRCRVEGMPVVGDF